MLNILKADFYKLKKSRFFWICLALCLVFGIVMVVAIQAETQIDLQSGAGHDYETALETAANASAVWGLKRFLPTNFSALIAGVFIAVFVTSEFSYGTMKNTLSRGADRAKVFFSKFLVCGAASLAMQVLFLAGLIAAGTVVWGYDPQGIATPGGLAGVILSQLLVMLGFTALFTFTSMAIRANGGAIAVNILCSTMISMAFSALGMLLGIKIAVNDYWIGGVVEKLATIPAVSGDVLHGILVVLAWGVASLAVGTTLFKKMDVK